MSRQNITRTKTRIFVYNNNNDNNNNENNNNNNNNNNNDNNNNNNNNDNNNDNNKLSKEISYENGNGNIIRDLGTNWKERENERIRVYVRCNNSLIYAMKCNDCCTASSHIHWSMGKREKQSQHLENTSHSYAGPFTNMNFLKPLTPLIMRFFFKRCFIMVWEGVLWTGLEVTYVDVNTMLLITMCLQTLKV